MEIIVATEQNFENEVINSEIPALVEFWAPWCGACRAQSKALEQLAETAEGFKVIKLDVDKARSVAEKYEIRSLPTVALFSSGELKKRKSGAMSLSKMQEFINS